MKKKLGLTQVCEILLRQNLITAEQKDSILLKEENQKNKLTKLNAFKNSSSELTCKDILPSDIIIDLKIPNQKTGEGYLTEETIMRAVADMLSIPFKKIDPLELDIEVVTKTVSKAFAIRNLVVPIEIKNNELKVAMVDPLDSEVLDDIKKVQKLKVSPIISTKSDILKTIKEFYGFQQSVIKAEKELVTPIIDIGNLEQYSELGNQGGIESTDKHIQNAVDHLFTHALEQRASDIHIEPKRNESIVRIRIDGVLHVTYTMPKVVHNAVVSRLKSMSRLNIAEKRRPQDGRTKLKTMEKDIEIRVSTIPVAFGEKVVMRVLNPDILFQDLENLGFLAPDLIHYRKFLQKNHGIILVTGPTGSGKTTTLYSSLRTLASPAVNITTVEDPIEMVHEDFNQIAVQPAIDITFASILKNILRQDPDIIMIGEIRDHDTARNAIQAALTGHLVLSTLHTNDAASAVTRLIDLGIEPFLISSTVLGIIAQRLVRSICPHCEETFTLEGEDFENLGFSLPADFDNNTINLKKGKGCRHCRDTGYRGREGIFEVLTMSDEIKKHINTQKSSDIIKQTAQKQGMKLLRENAVTKVLKGKTTYNEVLRCISQED
jgi:general secretion pathway protein E